MDEARRSRSPMERSRRSPHHHHDRRRRSPTGPTPHHRDRPRSPARPTHQSRFEHHQPYFRHFSSRPRPYPWGNYRIRWQDQETQTGTETQARSTQTVQKEVQSQGTQTEQPPVVQFHCTYCCPRRPPVEPERRMPPTDDFLDFLQALEAQDPVIQVHNEDLNIFDMDLDKP